MLRVWCVPTNVTIAVILHYLLGSQLQKMDSCPPHRGAKSKSANCARRTTFQKVYPNQISSYWVPRSNPCVKFYGASCIDGIVTRSLITATNNYILRNYALQNISAFYRILTNLQSDFYNLHAAKIGNIFQKKLKYKLKIYLCPAGCNSTNNYTTTLQTVHVSKRGLVQLWPINRSMQNMLSC